MLKYILLFVGAINCYSGVLSQDKDISNAWLLEMMAQNEKDQLRNYGPVVVRKLTVNIEIDTTGFFTVEENYDVYFNEERRGILRYLKLKYLLDITVKEDPNQKKTVGDYAQSILFSEPQSRRISITNIDVPGHTFDVSGNHILSDQVEIKIGDADKYLTGPQKYTINYRVENAFLFRDSIIDFYWNFLGGGWDMKFLEVDFNIKLQGDVQLDSNRYYLYGGSVGNSTPMPGLTYTNNTLSGKSPIVLEENNDLTILLHLPANYVPRPTDAMIFWSQYAWPILPLLCVVVFIFFWLYIGRDKRLVKQVQYNPPKDVDPALAGFLIDSKSNNRDLVALLPYWAAMGVITMVETNTKTIFGSIFRRIFFYSIIAINVAILIALTYFLFLEDELGFILIPYLMLLFIIGPIIYRPLKKFRSLPKEMEIIKLKDLYSSPKNYERTIFKGLFKGNSNKVKLSSLKTTFYETMVDAKSELKEAGLKHGYTKTSEKNINRTRIALVIAMLGGAVFLFFYYHVVAAIIHILICAVLLFFSRIMNKRTSKGDELLKDVIGFRMFIDKADKHKIEFLLKEDPRYFEKTIAYAVAFGMAEKWCKRFEGLVPPPNWYQSSNDSHDSFGRSFSNMISTASVTMSVSPPSSGSSSGGSFGGGSSGGGFGGGGGSSW